MLWNALFEYATPPSNGTGWREIDAILNSHGICLTELELLMGGISRWKNLRSLVPYEIITKVFQNDFVCNMRCSLQFYSNRCWTMWAQQWFWGLLNSKMGEKNEKDSFYIPAPEKTRDFTKKCLFFLLMTKSSHWSIGWCDYMPVNNWQMKQEKILTNGCH